MRFSVLATLILGTGIGCTTTSLYIFWHVVLRPLPVKDPHSLFLLQEQSEYDLGAVDAYSDPSYTFSYGAYDALRKQAPPSISLMATALTPAEVEISSGVLQEGYAEAVSGGFFSSMSIVPSLGRLIYPGDDTFTSTPVVVLSDALWQSSFGANKDIIGKTILISGLHLEVIGVSGYPGTNDAYAPLIFIPLHLKAVIERRNPSTVYNDPLNRWLTILGRCQSNCFLNFHALQEVWLSTRRATADASGLSGSLEDRYMSSHLIAGDGSSGLTVLAVRYGPTMRSIIVICVVLLVVCMGTAGNMFVRRLVSQRPELAIKLAMGATRRDLIAEAVAEVLVVCLSSFLYGTSLTMFFLKLFSSAVPLELGRGDLGSVSLPVVLSGALFTSFLVYFCISLAPLIYYYRANLNDMLSNDTIHVTATVNHMQRGIASIEIAMTVSLLAITATTYVALHQLYSYNLGFSSTKLGSFALLSAQTGVDTKVLEEQYNLIFHMIGQTSGIEGAARSAVTFLSGDMLGGDTSVPGYTYGSQPHSTIENWVSSNFFSLLHIPLLAGRTFEVADESADSYRVVVDEAFADRYFGSANMAINHSLYIGLDKAAKYQARIIGVVGSVHSTSVYSLPPWPSIYFPYNNIWSMQRAHPMVIYFKTSNTMMVASALIGRTVHNTQLNYSVSHLQKVEEAVSSSLSSERLVANLTAFVGLTSVLLVSVSLHDIFSLFVQTRKRNLAIRLALGSPKRLVWRMVLAETTLALVVGYLLAGAALLIVSKYAVRNNVVSETMLLAWALSSAALVFLIACCSASYAASKVLNAPIAKSLIS